LDALSFANSPAPFLPNRISARNGAFLDLTQRNETLPEHDTLSNPGNSFDARIAGSGGTLNLFLENMRSPDGYLFRNDDSGSATSDINIHSSGAIGVTNASIAQVQPILVANNDLGGGNNDNQNPPTVNLGPGSPTGVNIVDNAPTLPIVTAP
jgi:hypothetical protein